MINKKGNIILWVDVNQKGKGKDYQYFPCLLLWSVFNSYLWVWLIKS